MKKNFLIIGAGLSGCVLSRLLLDRGHDVVIYEKNNYLRIHILQDVLYDSLLIAEHLLG